METNTKYFGTMPYTEDEVITFENGIFGFEENKRYLLIRFEEDKQGFCACRISKMNSWLL